MDFKQYADTYYESGLSVIPIDEKKVPIGGWKERQEKLQAPIITSNASGIGVVCGKVSGNVSAIDVDTKYDLTKSLFTDYIDLIKKISPGLMEKMVVQQTRSGGYHLVYKCEKIYGNTKLAQRDATAEELIGNTNNKVRVLIETRGEGGYIAVYPTPNYSLGLGELTKINTITEAEQEVLFDCARTFNTYINTPALKSAEKKHYAPLPGVELSAFDDYNQRGDVLSLLQEYGWKETLAKGSKHWMLRPGGEGNWSADWDDIKRIFYVWSTSTEFESNVGHNAVKVLTVLKFNGSFEESSRWLYSNGYGTKHKSESNHAAPSSPYDDKKTEEAPITDFIISVKVADDYLESIRNGTFEVGKQTGIPELDNFWRLKKATSTGFLGLDNVGKSAVVWYIATLAAQKYGFKFAIHHAENKSGGVKRKLIEFYTCKSILDLKKPEYMAAKEWVEKHFYLLTKDEMLTVPQYLGIAERMAGEYGVNGLILDPYNSFFKPENKERHEWDYRVMSNIRGFVERNDCTLFLLMHAVTEALRRKYPAGHRLAGYPMPPDKSDAEGGGKFANRLDDFVTIHRLTQHPTDYMITEFHVKKIKEMETGGRPTPLEEPVKLVAIPGMIGFESEKGFNPMLGKYSDLKNPLRPPVVAGGNPSEDLPF